MEDRDDETQFDKFLDEIVAEEAKKQVRTADVSEDTPSRLYQKRYREYHNNRIFFRRSK